MHDSVFFENKGIPTAAVATAEFLQAARVQAAELGLPQYAVVTVRHPIQPLLKDEVRGRADEVMGEILSRLMGE